MAGQKIDCLKCRQRLQIPVPPGRKKTILGKLLPSTSLPSVPAADKPLPTANKGAPGKLQKQGQKEAVPFVPPNQSASRQSQTNSEDAAEPDYRQHEASQRMWLVVSILIVLSLLEAPLIYAVLTNGQREKPTLSDFLIGFLFAFVIAFICQLAYIAPAIIAYRRNHPQKEAILIVNIFLAWSFVFWAIAMVWAHTAIDRFKQRRGDYGD